MIMLNLTSCIFQVITTQAAVCYEKSLVVELGIKKYFWKQITV